MWWPRPHFGRKRANRCQAVDSGHHMCAFHNMHYIKRLRWFPKVISQTMHPVN